MGVGQISYTKPGPTVVTFNIARGLQSFIAEDSARRHDNISTSGLKESVYEATDLLIGFTMPGMVLGGDYTDWRNFYAWALAGGTFIFVPNSSVTLAAAP